MVETAFCFPFVLFLLVGLLYFGRYFYIQSIVSFAAQQGALLAARTPNLQDSTVRDSVRGFSQGGQASNSTSLVYNILASAQLLTAGSQGNLPDGAQIAILPYDNGTAQPALPSGAVAVQITYPFSLMGQSSSFSGPVFNFSNMNVTQQAAAYPQVYEE